MSCEHNARNEPVPRACAILPRQFRGLARAVGDLGLAVEAVVRLDEHAEPHDAPHARKSAAQLVESLKSAGVL